MTQNHGNHLRKFIGNFLVTMTDQKLFRIEDYTLLYEKIPNIEKVASRTIPYHIVRRAMCSQFS